MFTKEQIEFQLNRVNSVLESLTVSDDDRVILEQQKASLEKDLSKFSKLVKDKETCDFKPIVINGKGIACSNCDNDICENRKEVKTDETKHIDEEYEAKVDKLMENVSIDMESTPITEDDYKTGLKGYIDKYQQDLTNQKEKLQNDVKAQEKMLEIIKQHLDKELSVVEPSVVEDIKGRENIIENAKVAIKIITEELTLYPVICDAVNNEYQLLVTIDRYFGMKLGLEENYNWVQKIRDNK